MTAINHVVRRCRLTLAYTAVTMVLILQAALVPSEAQFSTQTSQAVGGTSSGEIVAVPFEWNVFLGPWHVIGPFPKPQPEGERRGLQIDYVGGEPQVRLDASVSYEGMAYRWKRYDRQVLDLFSAFATDDKDYSRMVAYAETQFLSDKAQDATLAIGSDDGFVAWLNGQKVAEHIAIRATSLDDDTVTVHLREGENRLLLKVENWYGPWGAVARLLPPHIDQPLLNFEWTNADSFGEASIFQLPDLNIDYLDSRGQLVGTQRCSGFRAHNWTRPLYQLYADAPQPTPESVRVRIDQAGYAPFEKIVPWSEAWHEPVMVAADGLLTVTGHVVDTDTRNPIVGARVVSGEYQLLGETSGPDGSFQLHNVSPFFDWMTVAALGHMVRVAHLGLDESLPVEVALKPGGRTLQGQVVDDQDNPIEGVSVYYWYWGDHTGRTDQTDREGRFLLSGISASAQRVCVTVQHRDYVPISVFSQDLGGAPIKEVVYRMQPGAIVMGQVMTQSGRHLLSGVKVAWGQQRSRSWLFPDVFTDVDGRYRLTDVPLGPNLVVASSDEFAPATQQIDSEPGYMMEVNLALEPGQDIAGRVVDPNGKPITRARVLVDDWNGLQTFERDTVTDNNGNFVLHQMPPTSITLVAGKDGYLCRRGIHVVNGNNDDIVLQLAPSRTIQVSIEGTAGSP